MAPLSKNAAAGTHKIANFFKSFVVPQPARTADPIGEEIVVSSPSKSKQSTDFKAHGPALRASDPSNEDTLGHRYDGTSSSLRSLSRSPTPPDEPHTLSISSPADTTPTKPEDADGTPEALAAQVPAPLSKSTSAVNISFTSISSGHGASLCSQTSSRRITKGGLKAVTNSDSDEGSSDDSSDEELLDPSAFLVNKRRKLSPVSDVQESVHHSYATPKPDRAGRRSSSQPKVTPSSYPRSPPPTTYRHSLANLVAQKNKLEKSEVNIASLESALAGSAAKAEAVSSVEVDDLNVAALVGGDSDDQDRMLQALSRTEALKQEQDFHFFLDDDPLHETAPFPQHSLPDPRWRTLFLQQQSRTATFTSGFAKELAERTPFPMNITSWIAHQLLYEQNDFLCEAYIETLRACTQHEAALSDSVAMLSSYYKTRSLSESQWQEQSRVGLPRGLRKIIRVVAFCAPSHDAFRLDAIPSMTTAAYLDLAMVAIDTSVCQHPTMLSEIHQSMGEMLYLLPESLFRKLIPSVVAGLFQSDLPTSIRYRIIASLPAFTLRTNILRRRLALECFSTASSATASDSQDWAQSLVQCLQKKPECRISENTDYSLLSSLIAILDIAISGGFSGVLEDHGGSNSEHADASSVPPPSASSLSPPPPPPPPSSLSPPLPPPPGTKTSTTPPSSTSIPASTHNAQIDAIISRLEFMSSRIRDAGASHLQRKEAKGAIERVVLRLEHTVRTRPRVKQGLFDAAEPSTAEVNAFQSWFQNAA